MKRCPECRRDYYDDSLLYCLDDGSALLEGPASGDESATAILHETAAPGEAATRAQIHATAAGPERRGFDKRLLIGPIFVAVIVAGGVFSYRYFSSASSKQIDSIAVMPFVNESGSADAEYLSDGMTETLISSLSQLPNLNVKARSSVFRYKGKETSAQTIGKELNVQAILNGRIVQHAQELILYIELVDVATENSLWKQSYNKTMTNLVSLQNEIARDVADKLKVKLSGTDQQKLAKNSTENPEAYKLYLKGSYELNKRTEDSFKSGIEFFRQAIEQDPKYALAYAGLADAYVQMGLWATHPPGESFPQAKAAAQRALQLDETVSDAHTALAFVKLVYEWDFAGAETECQRAISLNPSSAQAHDLYGYQIYLTDPRRFDSAFAELKTAQEIDPLSLSISVRMATLLYFDRQYDKAIEQMKAVHNADSSFTLGYGLLGAAYREKGMHDESFKAYLKGSSLEGVGFNEAEISVLQNAYRGAGMRGYWRKHAELLQERAKGQYVSPIFMAMDYASLGEKDLALAWLDRAFIERSSWLVEIGVDPNYDSLRSVPRFQDLVRRIGLPHP